VAELNDQCFVGPLVEHYLSGDLNIKGWKRRVLLQGDTGYQEVVLIADKAICLSDQPLIECHT